MAVATCVSCVLQAYMHAVTCTRPRIQYRVGIDAKYLFPWLQIFPLRVGEAIAYYAATDATMRKPRSLKPEEKGVEETKAEA